MGRPACSDRIIYYSSLSSQMIKMNSRQSLTYQHWIQFWAIVIFETNGQLFFYSVLSDWINNKYLLRKKITQCFNDVGGLYYMYCQECITRNRSNNKNGRIQQHISNLNHQATSHAKQKMT